MILQEYRALKFCKKCKAGDKNLKIKINSVENRFATVDVVSE